VVIPLPPSKGDEEAPISASSKKSVFGLILRKNGKNGRNAATQKKPFL
jgi:hypothetical protein